MDDEAILARGGDEEDIKTYANEHGANLTAEDVMREWEINKRLYVTEAICPHGIGHHKGIHGCDGCCKDAPAELWSQVTEDK